ncbi:MAG: lipopolysaccharide biosynthesis protein [Kiritimatiellae bacterium]|jgi:O-antigen/teichoic acid export membrane protein|nr:lipopolysaccharide biosynthesis protein [Kiritimatiellia bacterium]NLD90633.1 lipopolysaccharide biosynthesis protein [Lentisphaerota bacterium]HPC19537.1 lipopolysaccharide biosynthesis protein [Kiritimatiellia bacterium]HQN80048.1 lipopolysaccharide biosynthesis protein [Kiritimatiellia bacterium]HQQ60292.1 lipopolysaccharide biosynthesis protein [Kiritimatiellia bacterium]
MSTPSENNRRIARNTLLLYFRTGITMLVTLFTSRIVLNALGVEDYGIYSVVGGLVVLFTFLNVALSSATQRFLNFELGRRNFQQMARVFSASLSAHFGVAFLVVLLAETAGLWFLKTKMVIPAGRLEAANWVYQLSILTTVVGIVRVPYNATILAYERMSFYAYTSLVEAGLRLGVAYALLLAAGDALVLYALLIFGVTAVVWAVYYAYCRWQCETTRYRPEKDGALLRAILGFSGWSLLGNLANMGNVQGLNLLINLFCGVAVNAAMGIASQVSTAVYQLVVNFQTAFNPQIVQLCARDEREHFLPLVFRASKFSFYLLLLIALPIALHARPVLQAWLGTVPPYAPVFLQLIMVSALTDALAGPLWMSAQAFGNIRFYQIVVSLLLLSNLPLAYAALRLGASPAWVLALRAAVNLAALGWRILYFCGKAHIPVYTYARAVLVPAAVVLLLAAAGAGAIQHFGPGSWIVSAAWTAVWAAGSAWLGGLRSTERQGLVRMTRRMFKPDGLGA